jgi:molybdopterin molybdotransferase
MDSCDTQGLMSIESAMDKLLGAISAVTQTEQVDLPNCLGRILAGDVQSTLNMPPHDNSAMDGYALQSSDLVDADTLQLVGQSFAGHPYDGEVSKGQCIRIMTGATIPKGADCVVMQERAEAEGDGIRFTVKPPVGNSVRRCGEDIAVDDVVLKQGRRISAADVGLLASLGLAQFSVFRTVKVAVFSTGDELKTPGQPLNYGDIYESNRFTVSAMLSRMNVEIIDLGIIPDDKNLIRAAFKSADEQADVVVSSGGVSVGDADYTKDILEEQGQIGFWKLAIKPGKPFAFGQLPNSHFIGLPGNPVSSMVTFHQLAVPVIRKLMGQSEYKRPRFKAKLTSRIGKRPGRTDYQRGIFGIEDGQAVVCTTGSQGSGILSSMSVGDCYIIVERERGTVEVGEEVTVELFDGLIGAL